MAIVAQTKTKSKARRSGSSNSKSSSSSSRSRAKGKASQKPAASTNGVADSIKDGAGEVGPLVRKAKVPLLASGAALAGVAGAVVASRSSRRHKVLGVSMPKRVPRPKLDGKKPDARKISGAVVDAAERANRLGQGVSRVASSVRDVGETANKAAKKT